MSVGMRTLLIGVAFAVVAGCSGERKGKEPPRQGEHVCRHAA